MSGARSQAMWVAAAVAGLEVATGAGLVVAPSLLARLLFGSEMNASGDLAGRIAGLVIVCLALGCWPRASVGQDRQALAPLIALSLLAAVNLANIHGAVDGGGGYTYFDPQTGHEFSAVTGLTYNLSNPSTNYQGAAHHLGQFAKDYRDLFGN